MIRGEVQAYEIEAASLDGEPKIDRARWVQGPVENFDAIAPGMVLKYAAGEVHLKVLAVNPAPRPDEMDCKIVCGVLKPSTRRAFKMLRALPWWEWKYAAESEFL